MALQWRFQHNQAREREGPQNPGLTLFANRPQENLVRECIQNSLDAALDKRRIDPVHVEFRLGSLPRDDMDADRLDEALERCILLSADNDDENRERFRQGLDLLRQSASTVPCLFITDSRTTGAAGELWDNLTKGSGLNIKPDLPDAGGSFGLGKFATFAVTPLRTVLYATMFDKGMARTERFIGKTILVSHQSADNRHMRATGYLAHQEFESAGNREVPQSMQIAYPGVRIAIPGYEHEEDPADWETRVSILVLKHFYPALHDGKLEVQVGETALNASLLPEVERKLSSVEIRSPNRYHGLTDANRLTLLRMLKAVKQQPQARQRIADVGQVSLRVNVYPPASSGGANRDIALVRDPGMVILKSLTDMRHAFWPYKAVPRVWRGFSALVEVRSHGMGTSLLRRVETPAHDQIAYDLIKNEDERRHVKKALQIMGQWIYSQLELLCAPEVSNGPLQVNALLDILQDPSLEGEDGQGPLHGSFTAGEPFQSQKRLPPPRNPTPGPKSAPDPNSNGNQETNQNRNNNLGGGNGGGSGGNQAQRVRKAKRLVRDVFPALRFRPSANGATHVLVATFDNPQGPVDGIALRTLTDDGGDEPIGLRRVQLGNTVLPLDQGLFSVGIWPDTERVELELYTSEPVVGRTFTLVHGIKKK